MWRPTIKEAARGGRYPGTCIVGPDEGTCPMLLHLYWTGLPPVDRRSEEVTSVREGPVREPTLSLAPEYAGWICVTCIGLDRRLEDS